MIIEYYSDEMSFFIGWKLGLAHDADGPIKFDDRVNEWALAFMEAFHQTMCEGPTRVRKPKMLLRDCFGIPVRNGGVYWNFRKLETQTRGWTCSHFDLPVTGPKFT